MEAAQMFNEPDDRHQSRKDFARKMRRAAYLLAKERRVNDPKQIEMKAIMKQRRDLIIIVQREIFHFWIITELP